MKKISPTMIEAGVAALQRNTKMGEEALAAKVYSAMEAVRVRDEAALKASPHGYVHQAFPSWRYGPDGEGKVFNSADEVPESWTDTKPTPNHGELSGQSQNPIRGNYSLGQAAQSLGGQASISTNLGQAKAKKG